MLITLCRFFVLLSVFSRLAAALPAVPTDSLERTDDLSSASHGGNQRVTGADESSIEERDTISVSIMRKVIETLRPAVLASEALETANGRVRRNRDIDTADATADGSGRLIRKEGSSFSINSVVSSSTLEGLVTRHSKHRRRRRCKNRLGCFRSAGRNGTVTSGAAERIDDRDEARNDRSNEHHPIPRRVTPDRNLEKQLLLGNRSSALFRQGLVASTTGNASMGHVVDPSSREIDDILADARSRRLHGQSEKSMPDISSWRTEKQSNGTIAAGRSVGKRVTISVERHDKPKEADEETVANRTLSSLKGETSNLYHRSVHDRRRTPGIDKSASETSTNYRTETSESVQYKFKLTRKYYLNSTEEKEERDWSRDERKYDIRKSPHAGDGDSLPIDDRTVIHESLTALLSRLFDTLKNTTGIGKNRALLRDLDATSNWLNGENSADDLCQKWLDSKDKLEEAFLGDLVYLPGCPCQYPSGIFYDDKVWDEKQERYFRWRDVNGDSERMDVYKPGAAYCVRSLLSQGSGHAAAQHCCYDRQRRLLTRGSGAGTPNYVSPEISAELHERIDILPWRLCKGDFSRFNSVRPPNNDNHCKTNPDDDEYRRQINYTKHY